MTSLTAEAFSIAQHLPLTGKYSCLLPSLSALCAIALTPIHRSSVCYLISLLQGMGEAEVEVESESEAEVESDAEADVEVVAEAESDAR